MREGVDLSFGNPTVLFLAPGWEFQPCCGPRARTPGIRAGPGKIQAVLLCRPLPGPGGKSVEPALQPSSGSEKMDPGLCESPRG